MKAYRKELWFHSDTRRKFINITPLVEECLRESGIKEGLLLCNAMHITSVSLSMMMSKACTEILNAFRKIGLKNRMNSMSIMSLKIMPMPI